VVRWAGYVLAGIVGLLAIAALAVYGLSESKIQARFETPAPTIAASTDPALIMRGERLVHTILVCTHCHGENLAGNVVVDDPAFGAAYGANLTSGQGGIGGLRSDAELARAIRSGVRGDGHSMLVMPVEDYNDLSAEDLTAVVSYLRSLPPVDNQVPPTTLGPLGRLLLAADLAKLRSADQVPQDHPVPPAIPEGVTVEYGRYLARLVHGLPRRDPLRRADPRRATEHPGADQHHARRPGDGLERRRLGTAAARRARPGRAADQPVHALRELRKHDRRGDTGAGAVPEERSGQGVRWAIERWTSIR
jgi:hypothetical protein